MSRLVITETHPVQYHAPVYRSLAGNLGEELTILYGSDFSVAGYNDREFGTSFAWDQDLLAGMSSRFISQVGTGGAGSYEELTGNGLAAVLTKIDPVGVMTLGYSHPFDREAFQWAFANHKPVIFRGETSDKAKGRSLVKRLVRDFMLRRLYRRCAALLYVGLNSRAHYERLGVPASKLFFSPYCVAPDAFHTSMDDHHPLRHSMRQQLDVSEDTIIVLFSGKLSERKGVDLLPAAIRQLPESLRKRMHLLYLGDGALRSALEAQCAEFPKIPSTFAGFQNQSALSAYYHAADVFVLPSRSQETWGLVVNEALMHGLPCVVSEAVGSQPDLIVPGKTGAVCKVDDAMSLSQALSTAIQLREREETAEKCRDQVASYSIDAAAQGILQAWELIRGVRH